MYRERLDQLDDECYETMTKAYRKNTLKNLRSQALIYHRFCVYTGHHLFPASNWQMVRFARYVGNSVTSIETVQNYISGVRTLHRIGGFPVPDSQDPNLQLLLRGLKFELAHATKQAKPITPRMLFKIYQIIDLKNQLHVIMFAALILGFYLFLRPSNLVPQSTGAFVAGEQLTLGDIRWEAGHICVDIHWSKTVQYKQRINSLPLVRADKKELCPVFWIQQVLRINQSGPQAPLFAIPTSTGPKPITYSQLSKQFKQWMNQTGDDSGNISLHGLRRGGSCWALQCGILGPDIQLMGDWISLAYFRYLDSTTERKIKNMVKFVEGVNAAEVQ